MVRWTPASMMQSTEPNTNTGISSDTRQCKRRRCCYTRSMLSLSLSLSLALSLSLSLSLALSRSTMTSSLPQGARAPSQSHDIISMSDSVNASVDDEAYPMHNVISINPARQREWLAPTTRRWDEQSCTMQRSTRRRYEQYSTAVRCRSTRRRCTGAGTWHGTPTHCRCDAPRVQVRPGRGGEGCGWLLTPGFVLFGAE